MTEPESTGFRLTEPKPEVHVLLIEDDPGDVLMTREAFEHHRIRNHCTSS
jgi:hypothetical protein